MKLSEIAERAIEIIKKAGSSGIYSTELVKTLDIPRRRIYDIIAILSAAKLIKVKRVKGCSLITWLDNLPESSKKISQLVEIIDSLKKERVELEKKIKELEKLDLSKEIVLPYNKVVIKSISPGRIRQVYSTGLDAVVEADGPGIIILPKKEKKKEVLLTK
ncbi:MAG: hypothetical protein ACTSR0_00455 [Candidatus Asgardarchaeia archaeon]